jgi:hypothetical protein
MGSNPDISQKYKMGDSVAKRVVDVYKKCKGIRN